MSHRLLRSLLAPLLLAATLLPWLAGSAAGAAQPAPRRAPAAVKVLPAPFSRLWQVLVQLVLGSPAGGGPGKGSLPDAGCGPNPDGGCAPGSAAGFGAH
jgi:hypothetical protein